MMINNHLCPSCHSVLDTFDLQKQHVFDKTILIHCFNDGLYYPTIFILRDTATKSEWKVNFQVFFWFKLIVLIPSVEFHCTWQDCTFRSCDSMEFAQHFLYRCIRRRICLNDH